jgi:hypothetical protein
VLIQRAKATSFPWLMSNVIDNQTGNPLVFLKSSNIGEEIEEYFLNCMVFYISRPTGNVV